MSEQKMIKEAAELIDHIGIDLSDDQWQETLASDLHSLGVRYDPLTVRDALAISEIILWAGRTAKIARLDRRTESDVVYGHARSIGDRDFGFIHGDQDVRDAFLRVTTRSGVEVAWPIRELVEDYKDHLFTQYEWS